MRPLWKHALPMTMFGATALFIGGLAAPPLAVLDAASQSGAAGAASCHSPNGDAGTVNVDIAEWRQRGMTQTQIDNLAWAKLCLQRVDDLGGAGYTLASSSNSDVSAPGPTLYHDSQAHDYFSVDHWDWTDNNYSHDGSGLCTTCDIGGPDAAAVAFSTKLIYATNAAFSEAQWGDYHWNLTTSTTLCGSSPYGGGFCRQDKAYQTRTSL